MQYTFNIATHEIHTQHTVANNKEHLLNAYTCSVYMQA